MQKDAQEGPHAKRTNNQPSRGASAAALQTSLHAIAVDAAIWGMPIVSMDAMRQAYFRDAHAQYNDVVYWSEPGDWKLQITTPNGSTRYVYINFNTLDGPVVLDVPAATGAGLFGSILDAWQVPQIDVGPQGADEGKGGKYVLVPPGFKQEVPDGFIPVRLATYNAYAALRAISEGSTDDAVQRSLALVQQLRVYALADAARPHEQRFIDMAGKVFDGIVRFDASFYTSLARMVNEEPPLPRDAAMLRNIEVLGIKRGAEFSPDRFREMFDAAADDVHRWFMSRTKTEGDPFWPNSVWRAPSSIGVATHFTFERNGVLDVDERGLMYYLACAPPVRVGRASAYLSTFVDATGHALSGSNTYRLRVPANVPARQFWALTIYDTTTAGFVRGAPRVEINSYDQTLAKNVDGSIDLYIGPYPPAGHEANWINTESVENWFTLFRFYGPEPALYAKSWQLPNLERV